MGKLCLRITFLLAAAALVWWLPVSSYREYATTHAQGLVVQKEQKAIDFSIETVMGPTVSFGKDCWMQVNPGNGQAYAVHMHQESDWVDGPIFYGVQVSLDGGKTLETVSPMLQHCKVCGVLRIKPEGK